MTIPAGTPVVVADNSMGSTLLGFVVTALTWLAFGFMFCGGWHLMEWIIAKT